MFVLPLILSTLLGVEPLGPGDHTRTLEHDGRTRTYIVHVPPKYDPKHPVPVMHFHGTDDEFLPFKGGTGTRSLTQTEFYSIEHSITAWVKADGCPQTPTVTDEPKKTDDDTTVQRKTYGPGKDGAEVVLFVITGGGHTWPGQEPRVRFLGKSTRNISANDLMWEFFQKHPMN
jgi:polyhydroxybutyrate depolymerase